MEEERLVLSTQILISKFPIVDLRLLIDEPSPWFQLNTKIPISNHNLPYSFSRFTVEKGEKMKSFVNVFLLSLIAVCAADHDGTNEVYGKLRLCFV